MRYGSSIYLSLLISINAQAQATSLKGIKATAQLYCIDYSDMQCQVYLNGLEIAGAARKEPALLVIAGWVRQESKDNRRALAAYQLALPMLRHSSSYQVVKNAVQKLQKLVFAERVMNKGRRLLQRADAWLDE